MKVRIISGIVGVLLTVVMLILYKTFFFPLVIAALICIALYELFRAGGCLKYWLSVGAGFLYGLLLPFLTFYENFAVVIGVRFLCIIAIFAELVLRYQRVRYQDTLYIVAVTLLVSDSLTMMISLLQSSAFGLGYVILALCSAWISDTGAYFTGTFLGKHKLCPEISPKKTVEGFFGGILTDIIMMVLFALVYSLITEATVKYAWLIFAAIVCAVISVLGDLSASMIKRQRGIKDFGNIMPGHGGVMDRFDSVLFTIPAFYALICMSPIFV
ncbi:MAG: phosphatidate cytidylyltransferase [Ruminococcus sp.]|nr:phosphatidate cytidylyltransferase [Ruminococcus sp.]